MTTDEDSIGTLLTLVAGDEPPPTGGPAEVFRRAGAIRRRRRVATGVVGVVTVGLLTTGGIALADRSGSPRPTTVAAAPQHSLMDLVSPMLPAASKVSDVVSSPDYARFVITDGQGRSTVEVTNQASFFRDNAIRNAEEHGRKLVPQTSALVCETDGKTTNRRCFPNSRTPGEQIIQTELGTLGPTVVITEWNAVDLQHGPVTRREPTLTPEQLLAMAQRLNEIVNK